METMIQVNELTKVFKTDEVETWALDKVNIEIGQGEFVAVMGPSGCGKSTLLHILGLLDSPSSGQYLLDGKDVSSCSESKRNELRKGMLGFVFQSFNLIDELTVQENIALPLLYMGVPTQIATMIQGAVMIFVIAGDFFQRYKIVVNKEVKA